MKISFTLIIIFFLQIQLSAQVTFNLRPSFNHPTVGFLTAIVPTDSCYYAVGLVRDSLPPHFASSLFAKFDLDGDVEFAKVLSNPESLIETYNHPVIPEGDNFALIGQSLEINSQNNIRRASFLKYNTQGDTVFFREYLHPEFPEENFFSPRGFAKTSDGGYVFCLWISATDFGVSNTYIMVTKINTIGNIEWQKTFGDNKWDIAMSVTAAENGKIVIGGAKSNLNTVTQNYLWQTHIIGLDSLGNQEWSYLSPPDIQRDGAKEMVLLDDGSLIVASGIGYEQERASVNDMWFEKSVFKLNPDHELEWEKEFKSAQLGPSTTATNLIALSDDSGFIVTGTDTYNPNISWIYQVQGWIMKMDANGDSLWTRKYIYPVSEMNIHRFNDIKETPDGGFILCGESLDIEDNVEIPQQSWLLKLDDHGCLIPGCYTATEEVENGQLPFKISIYPNPTTDYLNIYHYFSEAEVWQNGQYRILDSQGRIVEQFAVGQNDVTMVVPVWEWAKGIYFLQLVVADGVVKTEKFIKN
ncbi:MAG: hypothetical protein ACJAYJ_004091 [Saprospiraceae bacterium]|jgi:hypothetical protein